MEKRFLFKKTKRLQLLFLVLPRMIFLTGLGYYEIRTGFIPNIALFYAIIYFLVMAAVFGLKPWWHYLTGALVAFLLFLFAAMAYSKIFSLELFGGGTIKLMVVIGAALGLQAAFWVAGCVFLFQTAAYFFISKFIHAQTIPSVPLIFISVLVVLLLMTFSRKKDTTSHLKYDERAP